MLAAPDLAGRPNVPFVIADAPGTWTVSDVQLGNSPAKPGR